MQGLLVGLTMSPPMVTRKTGGELVCSTTRASISQQQQEVEDASLLMVVSFYKFAPLPDFATKREPLLDICNELGISGGIILAEEGINGSICGTKQAVAQVLSNIQSDARLENLRTTAIAPASAEPIQQVDSQPFRWGHVRVKLKKEVVSLGVPGINPCEGVGRYVKPAQWNELISDPSTMVIDVRNTYEIRLGKFRGAVDPTTESFKDFPSWVNVHLLQQEKSAPDRQPQRIATYCTGGIRCEKATAYLLKQGIDEVYHLEGGILRYLEEIDRSRSLWEGECFVFDKRVSVEHGLTTTGRYHLCYACKEPVSDELVSSSPEWEEGVSCPYCFSAKSQESRQRARARQEQFQALGAVGGKPITSLKGAH